jgi:hypothetical protein
MEVQCGFSLVISKLSNYVQQLVLLLMTIGLHVINTYVNISNQTCSKSKINLILRLLRKSKHASSSM